MIETHPEAIRFGVFCGMVRYCFVLRIPNLNTRHCEEQSDVAISYKFPRSRRDCHGHFVPSQRRGCDGRHTELVDTLQLGKRNDTERYPMVSRFQTRRSRIGSGHWSPKKGTHRSAFPHCFAYEVINSQVDQIRTRSSCQRQQRRWGRWGCSTKTQRTRP